MKKKSCNIRDIAAYVKVSQGTVSRVLNNQPSNIVITEKTKNKVIAACEKLGYYPNIHAKRLFTNSSRTIGFVIPPPARIVSGQHTFASFNLAELLSGIEEVLTDNGYELLLLVSNKEFFKTKKHLRLFRNKSIDGMLIWGIRLNESYPADLLQDENPFILVDNYLEQSKFNFFIIDNEEGSFKVTEHLIKQGHRKIAYIKGVEDASISVAREKGYRTALAEYGLRAMNNLIEKGDYSMKSGYQAMKKILDKKVKGLSAVVAGNDLMAIGAMKAINKQGLKIPEDIAIVGGDGIPMSEYVSPALTTFKVPMYELGVRTAAKLLQIIKKGQKEPVKEVLETKLLIRQSSGGKV